MIPAVFFVVAGIASVTGGGLAIHGGLKMKDASDKIKSAQERVEKAKTNFEQTNLSTTGLMDELGKKELTILNNFSEFSDTMEKIQGRPDFKEIKQDGIDIAEYEGEELKKVSVGAGVLLGGLGGSALGTAGGFAAAGVTTSAVMAFGVASTGTAISSLSGAAAVNATLAALGGGAIAAGGGGVALGTVVLGVSSLGIGLLIGGIIFNFTGGTLSDKADEAVIQSFEAQKEINKVVSFLNELKKAAEVFFDRLNDVEKLYISYFKDVKSIVEKNTKWSEYSNDEKEKVKRLCLIVGLLYEMCKTKLVLANENVNECNIVNHNDIDKVCDKAEKIQNNILK